jgi:UDPglucose 6-dehydrogenase
MSSGHNPHILESVMRINESQPRRMIDLLEMEMDIKGKNVAVLGLSFKPNTDDIRGAPSINIIGELLKKGANVTVYDPRAMKHVNELFGKAVDYADSAKAAIKDKEAVLFCTEWEEFKTMNIDDFRSMKQSVVIDGRRIFDPQDMKGIRFRAIGYGKNIK